jgi:hypothetical protein
MENAGNKESGNRNDGAGSNTTDVTGVPISDGGSIRSNDGKQQSVTSELGSGQSGQRANTFVTSELGGGHTRNEIASGYYFSPRGKLERIPEGYFVDARDGRLRKRRKRNSDNAIDGNENRNDDNRKTSNSESEFSSQANFRDEKPLNIRGRKKRKVVKEETQKLTMITLLASGCSAIFTCIALLTKHDHWALQHSPQNEAKILAEALNDAIDTLPAKQYDIITSIVEKWIPWINLCFVVSALVYDRIEQSRKLTEETHNVVSQRSDNGNAASTTQASKVSSNASLGYGQ